MQTMEPAITRGRIAEARSPIPTGTRRFTLSGDHPATTTLRRRCNAPMKRRRSITQDIGGTQTLLKTVTTGYQYSPRATYYLSVPTSTTTTWANGQVAANQKTYDTGMSLSGKFSGTAILGQVTETRDYDYGSGAYGGLLRRNRRVYMATSGSAYLTNGLLKLPYSVTTYNGAGTQVALTKYAYDGAALGTSGVSTTYHDASPPDGTGHSKYQRTSVSRWLNASGGYLVSSATFFDTGMIETAMDPKSNTTTYAYSTTYEGAYLTTVTNALTQVTTNAYDFNTGLLVSTTDPNLQPTTYTYDPETWRKTQVSFPDNGQTNICYSDTPGEGCASGPPYQINISKKITSSLTLKETVVVDGLGHTAETEITSDLFGTDYVVTGYDPLGRMASETNSYRTTSDSTYGTTSYQYDALNRTTLVTKPDGSTVQTNIAEARRW